MLCRKIKLILTSIFQVMAILRKCQILKNALYYWMVLLISVPPSLSPTDC
uniref:Uncharacterized protein n=1 Tax=Amphimedon queenslandica TaxID=400682 RepID=A0A1X7SIU8_AMPQE